MFPMRDGVPPELGVKGIDLAALAAMREAMAIVFEGIKYEWIAYDNGTIELQWYLPLVPFVRFKMPFTLPNLVTFKQGIDELIAHAESSASTSTD